MMYSDSNKSLRISKGMQKTNNVKSYTGGGVNHRAGEKGVNHRTHPDKIQHRFTNRFGK